jgi:hypothetical protein
VVIQRALSQDCPACAAANGLIVPKPAFSGTGTGSAALPAGVSAAVVTGTNLSLTVTNGFNFDPINPAGATGSGYIIITVLSGTTQIGRDSIPGQGPGAVPMPAGGTTAPRLIPLAGTVTSAGITVNVSLTSPAGSPITMDASRQIPFTANGGTVRLSSATVAVNQALPASTSNLDLSDIDEAVSSRVKSGKLFLTVTNPFAVGGTMSITFTGGTAPITKSITLTAASGGTPSTTTQSVALSESELESLLGHNVTITFGGTISGTTTVTPAQVVAVATRLELTISTKGSN